MTMHFFTKSAVLTLGFLIVGSAHAELKASQVMGQGLFEQTGGNSCSFCHGINGQGGNVKEAAKLHLPKTWKVYKALGGDAAFNKDKKAFVEQMKIATEHLVMMGAIRHNSTYKTSGFDWSKIQPYNSQMMGLSGAASVGWLKKYQNRGVNTQIAADSLWLHVQTLDSQGVFK